MRQKRTNLWLGLLVLSVVLILSSTSWAETRYRVRSGDSICKIARKFHVTPSAVREANQLTNDKLRVRQVLIIPEASAGMSRGDSKKAEARKKGKTATEIYIVQKGDTIKSIASECGISVKQLKGMNRIIRTASLKTGQRIKIPAGSWTKRVQDDDGEEIGDFPGDVPDVRVSDNRIEGKPGRCGQADILGKWKDPEERNLFIRVVKSFLGVPYRFGGQTLKGLDCSAFVKKVYGIFDISLPRTSREQAQIGKPVPKHELQEGDLVFFKRGGVINHVGIYVGNNEFVHTSSLNREAKVDSMDKPYFAKRFFKAVRIKELDQSFKPAKNEEN